MDGEVLEVNGEEIKVFFTSENKWEIEGELVNGDVLDIFQSIGEIGRLVVGLTVTVIIAVCAVVVVMVGRRVKSRMRWNKVLNMLKELEECYNTSVGRLRHVVGAMAVEMHVGLAFEGGSKLKMLLTYVNNLPNG